MAFFKPASGKFQAVTVITIFGLIESAPAVNQILPKVPELRFQNKENMAHHAASQGKETDLRSNASGKIVLDGGRLGPAGLLRLSNLQDGLFAKLPAETRSALIRTFESESVMSREPASGKEKVEVRIGASDLNSPGRIDLSDLCRFILSLNSSQDIGFQIWINPDAEGQRSANLVLFFSPRLAPKGALAKMKEGGRRHLNFQRKGNTLSYEVPTS